jgi:hypothetical protein
LVLDPVYDSAAVCLRALRPNALKFEISVNVSGVGLATPDVVRLAKNYALKQVKLNFEV